MKKSKHKATPAKSVSKPKPKAAANEAKAKTKVKAETKSVKASVQAKSAKPTTHKTADIKKAAKPIALKPSKPGTDKKSATRPQPAGKPVAPLKPAITAGAKGKTPATPSKGIAKVPENKGRNRLNREELKYFENLLNEKKETLIQELGYLEDNTMRLNAKEGAGDLSSHAYHLADHATETQDREQAFHMASREGRYLFYLEEALDRVRLGTYGVCKKCGKLIPKARLEAVPTAKMCIECKSKQEQAAEAEVAA